MNRQEFLSKLGMSALAITAGTLSLESCKKEDDNPAPSSGGTASNTVDFTLDLNDSSNSSLNNVGGSLSKNGILIVRTGSSSFVAVSQACTHQGCSVSYSSSGNNFPCPCHGSVFNIDGSVKNGPATSSLKKYNTTLTGNSLRVFS